MVIYILSSHPRVRGGSTVSRRPLRNSGENITQFKTMPNACVCAYLKGHSPQLEVGYPFQGR